MPGARTLYALKIGVFLICLLPLARLVYLGLNAGLGANPVEFITHSTGIWALVALLTTLSITPLRKLTGANWLVRFRRMLGLYAFFYASLHLGIYLWLDQSLVFGDILRDIVKRPFITVGFAAWLIMVPLALTSTQAMVRRLGRRWQRLHRLVYLAGAFAVLHFVWLVKKDLTEPLIYLAVFAALMLWRLPLLRRQLFAQTV
jgi:sulfoxide reductase heme-binding subunit YedZ